MTVAAQNIVSQIPDEGGTPPPPESADAPGAAALDVREAERFLYREARLADAHELDAWEALWTDDALYHVPIDEHADPFTTMSIIFDNRGRIATRIKQLQTGRRHAQRPRSNLVRSVTNVEILGVEGTDTVVGSVVQVVESRDRGTRYWAARVTHKLRRVDGDLRMSMKKVVLVDADKDLLSLSFLI